MLGGSPFSPASPQAVATLHLFSLVLLLGAAVFAIVAAILVVAALRFRDRPGRGEPRQDAGAPAVEIAWTLGAALLLLVIFIPTVRTMRAVEPPAGTRAPDLVVIGHQWWWEVRYPAAGITTANEIHIPAGRSLLVHVDSADVIHDFWVPQLARKIDLTPGHPADIWLRADTPGVYLGACAEYCGTEHAWMRIQVVADAPEAFEAWQAQQRRPAPAPATPEAVAGRQLYQSLACASCHTGLSSPRQSVAVGPDLGHVASRSMLAAGVLPNTPAGLTRWLRDPQAVKPGSLMPNFHLTDAELRQLTAYLETLR